MRILIPSLVVATTVLASCDGSEPQTYQPAAAPPAAPIAAPVTSGTPSPAVAEQIALGINMAGNLCAQVVTVSQLQTGGGQAYEVTCVEYRGGTGQVRYLVDLRTDPPTVSRP